MINVKLSQHYPNDFLTLGSGEVFYSQNNAEKREWNSCDVSEEHYEVKEYLRQKILVPTEAKKAEQPIKEKMKETIQKEAVITDKVPQAIKEHKTETSTDDNKVKLDAVKSEPSKGQTTSNNFN